MKFVFIADFFTDQVLGGGELNNDELIKILSAWGHQIVKINSHFVTTNFIEQNKDKKFIIANFINLRRDCFEVLYDKQYIIYEHDHKYLTTRNPGVFPDFKAPKEAIINYKFYKEAKAVLCQSSFHKGIVEKNLELENIISTGGNLWSTESLNLMREISQKGKNKACSILKSNIGHKNTFEALRFCQVKNLECELIEDKDYHNFLRKLGSNEKFIFFPKTPETLSRVVVEARMMGASVITNNLVGATKEDWFKFKGKELIKIMDSKRSEIPKKVIGAFDENTLNH